MESNNLGLKIKNLNKKIKWKILVKRIYFFILWKKV